MTAPCARVKRLRDVRGLPVSKLLWIADEMAKGSELYVNTGSLLVRHENYYMAIPLKETTCTTR